MAPKIEAVKRGRGRPAVFDRAVALKEAMKLFWERGYAGTSFDELIGVMGISASSFYNSFGNKEQLYREATEAYLQSSGGWFLGSLNDETIDTRTAFARLFAVVAREFTRNDLPLGCMISLACTHVPPGLESMRKMMAELRAGAEAAFAERIRKGIADGDVPKGTDVDALASYYSALAQGLAVHARDGASREKLLEIGRIGMLAWPTAPIKTNKSRGVGSTTVLAGFGGRPTPDRPAKRKR
jgi:AcrR family transcriptional regulator